MKPLRWVVLSLVQDGATITGPSKVCAIYVYVGKIGVLAPPLAMQLIQAKYVHNMYE